MIKMIRTIERSLPSKMMSVIPSTWDLIGDHLYFDAAEVDGSSDMQVVLAAAAETYSWEVMKCQSLIMNHHHQMKNSPRWPKASHLVTSGRRDDDHHNHPMSLRSRSRPSLLSPMIMMTSSILCCCCCCCRLLCLLLATILLLSLFFRSLLIIMYFIAWFVATITIH